MKLSNKQKVDLETILYFIPKSLKHIEITDLDIKKFFDYSDKGMHKEEVKQSHFRDGFNALIYGKVYRGRQMEMWEDGVLSGDMPYFVILGANDKTIVKKWWQFWKEKYTFKHNPLPREVVDFMKKEMFKGKDADVIEQCYQILIRQK